MKIIFFPPRLIFFPPPRWGGEKCKIYTPVSLSRKYYNQRQCIVNSGEILNLELYSVTNICAKLLTLKLVQIAAQIQTHSKIEMHSKI